MNARIWKETRPVLPALVVNVALTLLVFIIWRMPEAMGLELWVFVITAAIMGASVFGEEFQHRTLPMLLAQPTSRHKLWWEKMRVLAVALGVSSLVWLVCVGILAYGGALTIPLRIDDQLMIVAVLAMPLVIWCSAPYHTMAGRGTLLGTMFTLMVPMGVLG